MNQLDSFLQKFLTLLSQIFMPNTPVPPVEELPVIPPHMLNTFCLAIQKHEGWILTPPSRSVTNHNPGNCRYSSVGYLPIYEPVGKDAQNFAIFKDYETGFLYLKNLVKSKIAKHPTWTFYDFFNNYAPASDNNNPTFYAQTVAHACGVAPTRILFNLIY